MANDGFSVGGGLMQALKTRMQYQQSRQKVLAENVANADSPGFRPVDLKPPSADPGRAGVAVARTSAGHMSLSTANGGFDGTGAPRFETTPNGNAVNLEDEMLKVAQNQMDYQAVAGLYQRSLGMIRTAIGKKA